MYPTSNMAKLVTTFDVYINCVLKLYTYTKRFRIYNDYY